MPHNTRSWPNLFIIGAMKSGTSYLHSVLDEHPDIFMCRPKEPAYYADGHRLFAGDAAPGGPVTAPFGSSERRVTYQAMFAAGAGARWRGESSTVYTKRPRHEGIAARIAADCPDARLIYVMRDPVDRIVSHYFHQIGLTEEPGTLLEAVERDPTYVAFSNYAYQLEPYLEHFPASQIHVLTYESLVADPSTAVRDIFRWLDVPDDVPLSDLERRVNGGLDELPATTPLMATLARLNLRTLRLAAARVVHRATWGATPPGGY